MVPWRTMYLAAIRRDPHTGEVYCLTIVMYGGEKGRAFDTYGRDTIATMSSSAANISLDRMVRAVEKVRERLLRATSALENGGIPYAVVGGNAVAAWVSGVDESAVRNTQDVDLLLRRADLEAAKTAMAAARIDLFLDGPGAKARDAVHVVFAGEKVRPEYVAPASDVTEAEQAPSFRVLSLEALVRMKLTSFRDKDRTHLRDLLEVGLIDGGWCLRFPPPLAERLQELVDNPEG